jgi:hypothetical protein
MMKLPTLSCHFWQWRRSDMDNLALVISIIALVVSIVVCILTIRPF